MKVETIIQAVTSASVSEYWESMKHSQHKTFTHINHERLCAIIEAASHHVIYAAPSISESVAQTLCMFQERYGENATVRVIVNADAESLRLGFGEHDGLKLLIERQFDVRCAKGLRIAVLVADKSAWVYSPTPEIIFEQPDAAINNAVQVNVEFAEQILLSIAPDVKFSTAELSLSENISKGTLTPEIGKEDVGQQAVKVISHANKEDDVLNESIIAEDSTPEIGAEALTQENLAQIERELKENPPQKFDATRKVRVYQGYIQFVELSLIGCRLSSHTINIPTLLLNIAEDSDLKNRIRSTCRLVDQTSEFSSKVKTINNKVKKLRDDYLKSLGQRYGSVILRKQREEFDKKVAAIQEDLKQLSETVKEELKKEIENSREKLIVMLLPGVIENPPQSLKSQLLGELDKEVARKFIGNKLDKEIPAVDKLIGEMQLNCDYKDVTFDMLNDENFIKAIAEKYPYSNFAKLYSEQETIGRR